MMQYLKHHQAGFTLVELMLVILVMSGLALVATAFVDNAGQQMGFDQTKSRLEQVRRAIIGDTSRTINGQPELSGFVADMGRLPENLSELIEPQTSLWNDVPIPGGQLYGGWRGPYLDAMPESSGTRAFRDGWGNQGQITDANAADYDGKNYGWVFTKEVDDPATPNIDESAHIFMQSLGADFTVGPTDGSGVPYDKDYPAEGQNLIHENDWRINLQMVDIQINRTIPPLDTLENRQLELRIYSLIDGEILEVGKIPKADISIEEGVASQTFSIPINALVPLGMHAVAVVCKNQIPAQPYEGTCPSSSSIPKAQYFRIIPRSYQPPLEITWNTQ